VRKREPDRKKERGLKFFSLSLSPPMQAGNHRFKCQPDCSSAAATGGDGDDTIAAAAAIARPGWIFRQPRCTHGPTVRAMERGPTPMPPTHMRERERICGVRRERKKEGRDR
jgi:hypothetical protein